MDCGENTFSQAWNPPKPQPIQLSNERLDSLESRILCGYFGLMEYFSQSKRNRSRTLGDLIIYHLPCELHDESDRSDNFNNSDNFFDNRMPVRLSLQRRRRILQLYFNGFPQTSIADKVGVGQATVSGEVSRFKRLARNSSLEEASRLYGVEDVIEELRSLSVELRKLNLTPKECLDFAKTLERLRQLGGDFSDLEDLLRLCRRVNVEGFNVKEYFVHALRLARLEAETRKDYRQLVNEFELKSRQLEAAESRLASLEQEVKELEDKRRRITSELERLDEQLKERLKEANLTYEKIDRALKVEGLIERLKVSEEELGAFLEKLWESGLDLKTLAKIVEEFVK